MNETQMTSQDINREISDITEMAEREQVKLTSEVRQYLHDGMGKALDKAESGVTIEDMQFLEDVKDWMTMPEDWRNKYPNIETMKNSKEYGYFESNNISMKRLAELYLMTFQMAQGIEWLEFVDLMIVINKNGSIIWHDSGHAMATYNNDMIKKSPEDIRATNFGFHNCKSLVEVGGDIHVGENIEFADCPSLVIINKKLKAKTIKFQNCDNLEDLPEDMITDQLIIISCPKIKKLPESLRNPSSKLFKLHLINLGDCHEDLLKEARELNKAGIILLTTS